MDLVAADDFNQAARGAAGSMKVSSGREPPPHNQVPQAAPGVVAREVSKRSGGALGGEK